MTQCTPLMKRVAVAALAAPLTVRFLEAIRYVLPSVVFRKLPGRFQAVVLHTNAGDGVGRLGDGGAGL